MAEPLKTSLCYLEHDGAYLMLLRNKKAYDTNEGKWIGVGGKFLPGESAEACLIREVCEETGYVLTSWKPRGVVHFRNDQYPAEDMYLFTAFVELPEKGVQGELLPECALPWPVPVCEEGTFAWIPIKSVPELPLWEGDKVFLQMLADGVDTMELTLVYHGDELAEVHVCEDAL